MTFDALHPRQTNGQFSTKETSDPEVDFFDAFRQQRAEERLDEVTCDLWYAGPDENIAGYTYRADNHRPEALVEILIREGRLAPGARGMDPDAALDQLAGVEGVDREDETAFDSGDFPKIVRADQLTVDDLDWLDR